MHKRMYIILLAILAGHLSPFFSTPAASAEQPYRIAATTRYVNVRFGKIESRIELLETEQEKLKTELAQQLKESKEKAKALEADRDAIKKELAELKKSFTAYKTQMDEELNQIKKALADSLPAAGSPISPDDL